ncbi:MAG: CbrC family protein [Proteobacteria bacterium]|nr:CbrC family protein [Pseudomonadota bacterium]
MDVPTFRFHPTALTAPRSFTKTAGQCEVCNRMMGWLYNGPLYAGRKCQPCPDCIANGRLDAYLGDKFWAFFDIDLAEVADEHRNELLKRTPGFAVFNPFTWPAKDGTPLAFIGYGDEKALWTDLAARSAMAEAFGEELDRPSSYALVFRELDSGAYRVLIDLD